MSPRGILSDQAQEHDHRVACMAAWERQVVHRHQMHLVLGAEASDTGLLEIEQQAPNQRDYYRPLFRGLVYAALLD